MMCLILKVFKWLLNKNKIAKSETFMEHVLDFKKTIWL